MIVEKVNQYMASLIKIFPCHVNRASNAGHPCERFLVYARTKWNEQSLHDISLQYIFEEGKLQEIAVLKTLAEAGVIVVEQQRPFEWKKYNITGHIDGKVLFNNQAYPLEIKSMAPFSWQKINTVEDLLCNKMFYYQKYVAQLTLYMLMDNKDKGYFLLKNKSTGQLKEIEVDLDYDYAESILQKIKRVNEHIKNNTVPEPIDFDDNTCGRCNFAHICCNDAISEPLKFIEDPDFEDELDRREELKPASAEYNKLNKYIGSKLKNIDKILVGNYYITGKLVNRKGYTVEKSEYWQSTIKKI